ncbi:MAG TPA: hypothetical protein VN281_20105 [Verrucomicrobiae bacterium]|jgi:hypothetical protein|nr:hypothetical protein [Verrucomicrobiae bacterium]
MKHALILLISILAARASAQYSINWHKVAGGGGMSSNAQYVVSGTVGQHDAGGQLTGGNYLLTGGFWALYAVQTPGAPRLTITRTSTNTVVVSWPSPSAGFVLQQTSVLAPANWANVAQAPADNGTTKTVVINPPVGNLFFRLKQ